MGQLKRPMKTILTLILTLASAAPAFAQAWSGILAPARATDWTQAGIQGYHSGSLPSDSWPQCASSGSVPAYGSAGSYLSPSTIINAVAANSGGNCYVLLGAGDFYLSGNIRNKNVTHVELRGMGASATRLHFSAATTCANGGGDCEVSFEDNVGEYPGGVGTAAKWTAGYTQGTTSITVNNASILNITAGTTLLVLDQADTGYSGNTVAAGGSGTTGSSIDNGGYFVCGDKYQTTPTGCSYNGQDGNASRPNRYQEEIVQVTACSPSCSNAGSTTLTITPGLIHPNWSSGQAPEAWSIQAGGCTMVGLKDFLVDGSATTSGSLGVNFNNCSNFWANGLAVEQTYSAGISVFTSAFGDISSNFIYNAGQSTSGTDPNPHDPSGVLVNGESVVVANNIVNWVRVGLIGSGGVEGNVFAYNYLVNAFESNGDLWGSAWDGHDDGTSYNLWEGNMAPQMFQDGTHGGKLAETHFRNLYTGWESCSNGNCSPSATQKTANVDAVTLNAYNRYNNIVGNILGTPGINYSSGGGAYVFTNASQYWAGTGYGHIWNIGSGNGGTSPPIPIDPLTISTAMWYDNWDAANNAIMACTAANTPVAACTADQRGAAASAYPGLSSPSTTLPASFYYTSRPSWYSGSIAFPAIGPDVTGGNVGECGGTPNTAGQYAMTPAFSASQCAGQGLTAAWASHVNAIPAMQCFLNAGGLADGTGGPISFDRATCYGGTVTCADPVQAGPNYSGTYYAPPTGLPLAVAWSSPTPACTMHCTTDGSTPTSASPVYAPFSISSTTPIRCLAVQSGYTDSNVSGGTWTIIPSSPAPPTISGTVTVGGTITIN